MTKFFMNLTPEVYQQIVKIGNESRPAMESALKAEIKEVGRDLMAVLKSRRRVHRIWITKEQRWVRLIY